GRTQYHAMVQGMPKTIENKLATMINKIMWNNKPAGVNHDMARLPFKQGGKKVLDITIRNKAINMTRLTCYLADTPTCPIWAYMANDLIAKDIPKTSGIWDCATIRNIFLQTWRTHKQGARSKLPLSIRNMINTGLEMGVTFCPPIVTKTLRAGQPLWFNEHQDPNNTTKTPDTGARAECLQRIHRVYMMGDLTIFIHNHPYHQHEPKTLAQHQTEGSETCECTLCELYTARGCADPEGCRHRAAKIMNTLLPKWNQPLRDLIPTDCKSN
ncbi:hypothetical protein FA13DRAFT_1623548, partial [Coprinellus micaceus]